ncbi:YicC/YloC family endoribonuclease [Magnetospirillum moscoviense]|uniref:YicC family protein n=1 Tax=Magnetospirillum moscoviense TaxID=1437059 RepID=A0A178M776_9PROT|nr:YicC/YloC family endoribonuclease [Magnetospirillum moscoviense]OAN43908.1 hypothetical protein A6A05_17815 [Magnetospirillum moscoviense]
MTVASMTGYARAEGRDAQGSWVWEAKSVNGRGLELRLRLPPGLDALDPIAREAAARVLKRGNIQLSLNLTAASEAPMVRINAPLVRQLAGLAAELAPLYPHVQPASWDGLLAIKGVLEPVGVEEEESPDKRQAREAAIKDSLIQALDQLALMRLSEGQRIKAVLLDQLAEISTLSERAGGTAALRPEAVKERLRTQLAAILEAQPSLIDERIAQEVALLAVKADIREELDRLRAHVGAARELLAAGGAVGRKLDFLSQEFNREANTLCSKAQDVELTRIGLDLKAVIDQFREQVQNIE